VRTAEQIAAPHGWSVETCTGLLEIGCGTLDGHSISEIRRRDADLWNGNLRQDDPDFRFPEGESYREFWARVAASVAEIATRREHEAGVFVMLTARHLPPRQ
jgi:2,3-bisphosphoglycerate-dependent phosphoglycerate mutase